MGVLHERVLHGLGHEVVTVDPDPEKNADLPLIAALDGVDAAVVAVPPSKLATLTVDASAKATYLLVEKPMAEKVADAVAVADSVGHLVVGYTERHNPAVEQLRRNLELAGDIHHIAIQRLGLPPDRPTAHVALDLATHDLDVLRYLGFEPKLLHAAGSSRHVVATLEIGAATATLEASHLHPTKIRMLTVTGSEGMLALDYQRQTLDLVEPEGITPIPVTYEEPLARQWRAFPHGPDASDGIATLTLAAEIAGCDHSASTVAPPVVGATAKRISLGTGPRARAAY